MIHKWLRNNWKTENKSCRDVITWEVSAGGSILKVKNVGFYLEMLWFESANQQGGIWDWGRNDDEACDYCWCAPADFNLKQKTGTEMQRFAGGRYRLKKGKWHGLNNRSALIIFRVDVFDWINVTADVILMAISVILSKNKKNPKGPIISEFFL